MDPSLRILAFEPIPRIFPLLKINMQLNHIPDEEYQLVNIGLSDQDSTATMHYEPANPGASTFLTTYPVSGTHLQEENMVTAQSTTLDHFLSSNQINPSKIAYLWIDVEGFEGRFLAGAKNTLAQINVPIVIEFSPELLLQNQLYDHFIKQACSLYSSYATLQEPDKQWPVEHLKEMRNGQYDLFLLK